MGDHSLIAPVSVHDPKLVSIGVDVCDTGPVQLYDMQSDPLERNNLAHDSDHADLAAAFAARSAGGGIAARSATRYSPPEETAEWCTLPRKPDASTPGTTHPPGLGQPVHPQLHRLGRRRSLHPIPTTPRVLNAWMQLGVDGRLRAGYRQLRCTGRGSMGA